jgi:hypothetical protein
MFKAFPWRLHGLPHLHVRLALHSGEVYRGYDPIRQRTGLIGTAINLAARIEPLVPADHVYTTRPFVEQCQDSAFRFDELDIVDLPKNYGSELLFLLTWPNDDVDVLRIKSSISARHLLLMQPDILFGNMRTSHFASRLMVSTDAKRALARYCIEESFWKPTDRVYLESGTISAYMLSELYRSRIFPGSPGLIVTNNTAAALLYALCKRLDTKGNQGVSPDYVHVTYGDDIPSSILLIGGVLLDGEAATIPPDMIPSSIEPQSNTDRLLSIWKQNSVNHVIMMASRLDSHYGPCAATPATRRLKKLLMKFVAESSDVRLTIIAEADKLIRFHRPGDPADLESLPLPGGDQQYWECLKSAGKVSFLTAFSSDMTQQECAEARSVIEQLRAGGVLTTIVDHPAGGSSRHYGGGQQQ